MNDSPTTIDSKILDEVAVFLKMGLELEQRIFTRGKHIRELSKAEYGQSLLDARLQLLSIIFTLLEYKSGIPGVTNASISERLQLCSAFAQGVSATEDVISEGQYVKAAAVLKQDYELMTRIRAARGGNAQYGTLPNIRHAPEGSQRLYGALNDIAHIAKNDILASVMDRLAIGKVDGICVFAAFNKELAQDLYQVHVWLCLEVAREMLTLAVEMYGKETIPLQVIRFFRLVIDNLKAAGFTVL